MFSNAPLTELFEYEVYLGEGRFEYRNLDELIDYCSDHLPLRFTTQPSISLKHIFKVTINKSNGEVREAETKEVTWQE